MLAAVKNYDVICLQMRNHLSDQEGPIRLETNQFLEGVRVILMTEGPVKPALDAFVPKIFNYRLLALKWIGSQPDIDLQRLIEDVRTPIEGLVNDPRLHELAENALFALRCNQRVTGRMLESMNSASFSEEIDNAVPSTYEQFFSTLAMSMPDNEVYSIIKDFSHASLYIEFILVATMLIGEQRIDVSAEKLSELAYLIADAAQEYTAIATLLGILPKRKSNSASTLVQVDSPEDLFLSESGLSDFSKLF